MRSLILTLDYPARASYYDDWLDAFKQSNEFSVDVFNIFPRNAFKKLQKMIHSYDLIILLHACSSDTLLYLNAIKPVLQNRPNKLLAFVGNEYNHPGLFLSDKIDYLTSIKADYVVSQLPIQAANWVYKRIGAKIIELPHGLNPNVFKPSQGRHTRPIDMGFRSYRYPAFLGDNDRNRIFDLFKNRDDFRIDFSQEERLSRTEWAKFLNNTKAVIATEAGSFYLEDDDKIVRSIKDYVISNHKGVLISSHNPLRRIVSALPYFIKNKLKNLVASGPLQSEMLLFENLSYEDIYPKFFAKAQKCPHHSKAISSRHFDAIGTKTVQIMMEGYFNGILEKNKHYIALKSDFSNLQEVLDLFEDSSFCQKMVDDTYDFVIENHTIAHRLKILSKEIA